MYQCPSFHLQTVASYDTFDKMLKHKDLELQLNAAKLKQSVRTSGGVVEMPSLLPLVCTSGLKVALEHCLANW